MSSPNDTKPRSTRPRDDGSGALVPSRMRTASTFLLSRVQQIGIFIALIVIVLLFQGLTGGRLLTAGNVANASQAVKHRPVLRRR